MEKDARKQGRREGVKCGVRKGKALERENGIRNRIEDNMEEGIARERILAKLVNRYHLDYGLAEAYYVKFAV